MTKLKASIAAASLLAIAAPITAADSPADNKGSYLMDPRPIAKTPKFLGVNVEMMEHHEQLNLSDWLADSGTQMARVFHLDPDFRSPEGRKRTFENIKTKADFDAFRARLAADPERALDWSAYRFDTSFPLLGQPDGVVASIAATGVMPTLSIGYSPTSGPRPLLPKLPTKLPVADDQIDWGSAASAYEYFLACIHRYATRHSVTHFMMLNEPLDKPEQMWPIGVISRFARMALEDVRTKLPDKAFADRLRLSGPAINTPWEGYWPHVEANVDFLDFHHYDPDPRSLERKFSRVALRARPSGKKIAISEFNRISGALQPSQSLLCLRPSLELADMMMSLLSASKPQDAGCEFALLYQFAFPATHRSFKSLVYGDMNLVDWTGLDRALHALPPERLPTTEQMQLRMPTPAYHIFRMFTRCTPGASGAESFDVFPLTESKWGFTGVVDAAARQLAYSRTDREKYLANGGAGSDLRTLTVRAGDRFIILVLNLGPAPVKRIAFNLELLPDAYSTAVVRETSLLHRDEAILQQPLKNKSLLLDFPPESLTQIILTKEDLTKVSELKLEEKTFTPGTAQKLASLETTRLRALGKLGDQWLDLTDLNVVWSSSVPELVNVYQGGLVQRLAASSRDVTITAKTLGGISASALTVPGASAP